MVENYALQCLKIQYVETVYLFMDFTVHFRKQFSLNCALTFLVINKKMYVILERKYLHLFNTFI